jgi:hypothetical protein
MFEKHPYNKKFSIPHWDQALDDNLYFECFKNSSQQYKNEIYDIYFGVTFENNDVTYGNTMGVNASEAQYKNLLKIQEKYGVPISLTLNEMNRPLELLKEKNTKEFISFIKKYYDDGVRSCTISHTHLMRTGALQSAFPDMDWKNTVNHQVMSTQSVIDYAKLGYTTIQLDRNFNRNLAELKRVKLEADRLNVKTCLLIRESCMPECPFKTEHDCWQSGKELKKEGKAYWNLIDFTCNHWRTTGRGFGVSSPRIATDVIIHGKEDWNDFAGLVDIFKLSGRLSMAYLYPLSTIPPRSDIDKKFIRCIEMEKNKSSTNLFIVDDFKTVYENDLMPFHQWLLADHTIKNYPVITDINKIKEGIKNHFWNKKEAVLLSKVLKNCKNQCYKCHKCDDLFGIKKIDSILEL